MLNKKLLLNIFIVLAILLAVVLFWRFVVGGDEDTWLCQDGEWIKHGHPSSPAPTVACGGGEEKMPIQLFFSNSRFDKEYSCQKVAAVRREIFNGNNPEKTALELLLQGPSQEEKNNGYFSNLNEGVKIKSLTVENETAVVVFDKLPWELTDSSCRPLAAKKQIEETLQQFSSVEKVVISAETNN